MSEVETPVHFFDTSALVKRYHRETGTDVVDASFAQDEAVRLISDLSVIEAHSAFAKKVRTGDITMEDLHETLRAFAADIRSNRLRLKAFGSAEKKAAATLIETYGTSNALRTLDALQLAVMNAVGSSVIANVYCADQRFAAVIEKEGFAVIDPEQAP